MGKIGGFLQNRIQNSTPLLFSSLKANKIYPGTIRFPEYPEPSLVPRSSCVSTFTRLKAVHRTKPNRGIHPILKFKIPQQIPFLCSKISLGICKVGYCLSEIMEIPDICKHPRCISPFILLICAFCASQWQTVPTSLSCCLLAYLLL